ncbi:uncharacterized protein LOC116349668 [Contarinia nasturtii]|uniref:uncharacterized protein LOC116349668 n=1 Tax=Contarinia nasturtii TaxID=265458 RepID=UPI0012D392C8|nr:uncharacterized protein LOC116349668 [Contarinia nasturtii]
MYILRTMNRLQITFSNEDMIEQLLVILLTSVEQDTNNKLVEINIDINDQNDGKIIDTIFLCYKNTPWKKFKHVRDDETIQCIHSICEYLTKIRQVHAFVLKFLFRILSKNLSNSNEVLIIIQMLLSNPCEENSYENLHCSILESLLCEYRWKLVCDIFEDIDYGTEQIHYVGDGEEIVNHKISLNEIKNNILHTCLVIETVGCYAKYMQQNYRQVHLLKSLHLISEKLASKQYMIRASALVAMENMRSAYKFNTVSDLMQRNTDYLIHSINKSLVKPSKINEALHILESTLNYNFEDAQTHLENIVPTIIVEGSKTSHFRNSLAFMQLFKLMISTIQNLIFEITKNMSDAELNDRSCNIKSSKNHFEAWLHSLNAERVFIPYSNKNIHSTSKEHCKITTLVSIAANILKQAIPSLSSTNMQLKMITLECISIGLDIIKENENELLPLVHLLWEPIVEPIVQKSCNKSLRRYTIQLATKLIIYSKNFATSRSFSQFFPHIKQYFYDFSKHSLEEYSLDFKTLKDLLLEMPNMLLVLDFEERELEHILNSILSLEAKSSSLLKEILFFLTELSTFDINLSKMYQALFACSE